MKKTLIVVAASMMLMGCTQASKIALALEVTADAAVAVTAFCGASACPANLLADSQGLAKILDNAASVIDSGSSNVTVLDGIINAIQSEVNAIGGVPGLNGSQKTLVSAVLTSASVFVPLIQQLIASANAPAASASAVSIGGIKVTVTPGNTLIKWSVSSADHKIVGKVHTSIGKVIK